MIRASSVRAYLPLIAFASIVSSCDESSTGYKPFGHVADSRAAASVHRAAESGESAGSVTPATAASEYATLSSAYEANLDGQTVSLRSSFQAATDVHPGGIASLGAALDAQYLAALMLGAGATTGNPLAVAELDWAKEGLEKLPLSYIYFEIHRSLGLRTRAGLDDAYALFSFVENSAGEHVGIYAAAEEYAPNPTSFASEVEALLVEARGLIAPNTTGMTDPAPASATYDELVARIDRKLLVVFASGVHKYLELLQSASTVGVDGHLIEGRLFWIALRPYVTAQSPARATTITNALYPNGEAPTSTSFQAAFGLDSYVGASYDGSAGAAVAELDALLGELAAP